MEWEPEELQFLNLFGILRESVKILRSYAKLFLYLTVTLILPLCFVGLAHNLVTEPLAARIRWNEWRAFEEEGTSAEEKTEKEISVERATLGIIFAVYLVFLLALSLLSTAAIVYSVACIYTDKVTSYRKILSVVPRVWKRLIVTFFWAILLVFVYTLTVVLFVVLVATLFAVAGASLSVVVAVVRILFLLSMAILIYINCVWHLASVISVLEDSYGLGAMRKSLRLIQGKRLMAYCLFLVYSFCTVLVGLGFSVGVLHGHHFHVSTPLRVVIGVALILLLSFIDLVGFLVQTVFYFACKAYHRESIDRLALSEHLGAYLGEYVPLKGSIQMEDFGP